jgi:NAD(P)H-dependent flavin oxidoreductase YrpB (nitropropane dioxygenase family)
VIRTPLTDLLGIRHPIVQTGMGYVSGARLTAATSQAGGLGIIASATMSHDEMRSAIRDVKERTGAPFGVNLRSDAPTRPSASRRSSPRACAWRRSRWRRARI